MRASVTLLFGTLLSSWVRRVGGDFDEDNLTETLETDEDYDGEYAVNIHQA